ncbi:hypothetical protein K449DRAFT_453558 [Hypoxylon sp. EC38]|nr:hypothetical protein K449DRAFT_453558 [Hypoxylon sp. EC38]
MDNASWTGHGFGSPTSSESGTVIPTPSTSRASSISQPISTNIPSGPLNLTSLSTTSWRQPYPSVGQFAMTKSEEVVAAGPDGLFYFKRVRDHPAKPWSESRPFPGVPVTLNELTVSGLALYTGHDSRGRSWLYLYCVSGGVLYSFRTTDENNSSLLPDTSPPLAGRKVTGKPTVVRSNKADHIDRWSLVVPCKSGGLLHTSATARVLRNYSIDVKWEAVDHLAPDLGIISAVSVTAVHSSTNSCTGYETELVAVCISGGQLNVVQGSFRQNPGAGHWRWDGKTATRIPHPGEVIGNPILITDSTSNNQLDLIVPSVEGGIFHFVRTQSTPNEWHMIGRVAFPQNTPPASCISFHLRSGGYGKRELCGLVQTRGRLYHVKTTNDGLPWYNASLKPIVQPGPFFE